MKKPFPAAAGNLEIFNEFFESGLEESVSPFLIPESRKWGVRLPLKAALLAALLLLAAFLLPLLPIPTGAREASSNLCILFTFFLAGVPALVSALEDLFSWEVNIDVLMTLAAFLSVLIGSGREGALLLVLFSFSAAMEEGVRSKAKQALRSLKELSPQKAFVIEPNGRLLERAIKEIQVGDRIHVKAGEIVPLDGKIFEGSSSVQLAHLTGEQLPFSCHKDDLLPAGARNLEGALSLVVTQTSADSTLARIIALITTAQEAKPKLQRWFDRLSRSYALLIIGVTLLMALTLPLLLPIPYLGEKGAIYRSLAFLIAASPCALILAIPIAYLSAISACAKQGILLKGGVILDSLAECRILGLDKTGTLTTGKLHCVGMKTFGENAEAEADVLSVAYSLERSAVHPIADALVAYAEKERVATVALKDFAQIPGYGLQGYIEHAGRVDKAQIGSIEWILMENRLSKDLHNRLEKEIKKLRAEGQLATLLSYRQTLTLFRFTDTLRPAARPTLQALKQEYGMRLVLLTGDHFASAKAIAEAAGVDEYHAELLPEDKLSFISQQKGMVMVGDGINDAPALARAHVGISMGQGSRTAIDASDIVLLQDKIEQLHWLVKKAHQVVRIVRQNLILAAGAIVFASLPALFGWIPLWLAVLLHEGGTVIVGLNALRLLRRGL